MAGPFALLAAVALFAIFAQTWGRYRGSNPSPIDVSAAPGWVKWLLRHDPDPEPDPDLEPAGKRGYQLHEIDEHRTDVEWVPTLRDLPPAIPTRRRESALQRWVAASIAENARPGQIIAEGRRLFGVSESTMKRAIRKARSRT